MNGREWIERALRHEAGGPVPYFFSFTPPAQKKAERHFGPDLENALAFPMRRGGLKAVKPQYADPVVYGETIKDEFGVVWSTSGIDRGSPVGPCLREPSLAGYVVPDPRDESRYEELAGWCAARKDSYRVVWVGDLWERAGFMRGLENLLVDVALNRAFVDALLARLADYILGTMAVLFERCDFEAVALSDDYGTQTSLMISPADWRHFIKPRLRDIYGAAKSKGRAVFHHSCGHIVPVIGDMIDIGLDILNPVQPEAMDILHLKREFGRDVTFCGGLGTQDLLAYGSPERVRQEVRRLKRDMGRGGGFILEPGITIQADVPLANIVAMIEEARAE